MVYSEGGDIIVYRREVVNAGYRSARNVGGAKGNKSKEFFYKNVFDIQELLKNVLKEPLIECL